MFNLKRGRKAKGVFNSTNDPSDFDVDSFSDIIIQTSSLFPETKAREWSLKKEWVEFSKLLFSTTRPKEKYIRKAYDFFHRNEKQILLDINSKIIYVRSDEDRISCLQSDLSNATTIREQLFEEPNRKEETFSSQPSSIDISIIREEIPHLTLTSPSTETSTSECGTKHSQGSELTEQHVLSRSLDANEAPTHFQGSSIQNSFFLLIVYADIE